MADDGDATNAVRYWKIAPGEGAWNWDACREGGFIAIGWEELGDLSNLTKEQFDALWERVSSEHELSPGGQGQVWQFIHIAEGDKVVANKGTSKVLGIGTVTGPYYYVPGVTHRHRLPVRWDLVRDTEVDEYGWRRTLIELAPDKFEEIRSSMEGTVEHALTADTFDLLSQLHSNPKRDFYLAHKPEFIQHLEEPFLRLFYEVGRQLPPSMKDALETEKRVIAKILKNDFGAGGAWDYYWGAFYPKGKRRVEDAQLFILVNHQHLRVGFSIGKYSKNSYKRFLHNVEIHRDWLIKKLKPHLTEQLTTKSPHLELSFGQTETHSGQHQMDFESWFRDPASAGISVAAVLPREQVIAKPLNQLSSEIALTFEHLFPLVLLAELDEPLDAIAQHIGATIDNEGPEVGKPIAEKYSLSQCAAETGFEQAELERWVRAIERKGQAILYGPPGTGKTYIATRLARHLIGGSDGFVETVQFHPAYAYEDFIQGLRPQTRSDGTLEYRIVSGRFLDFCSRAESRTGRCVLIIDEINRANLSRVFGELMYLLEYRDSKVPLAAGGSFSIPSNVRLIGTMNTADRSIALVDHALRRRFAFLAIYPNYEVLRHYHSTRGEFEPKGLIDILRKVNQTIADPHYEVGVSFFLRKDLSDSVEDIWKMEIEPYLEEYFFNKRETVDSFRWDKVKAIINP